MSESYLEVIRELIEVFDEFDDKLRAAGHQVESFADVYRRMWDNQQ